MGIKATRRHENVSRIRQADNIGKAINPFVAIAQTQARSGHSERCVFGANPNVAGCGKTQAPAKTKAPNLCNHRL